MKRASLRHLAIVVVTGAALAACSGDSPESEAATPPTEPSVDLFASCGDVRFPDLPADFSIFVPLDGAQRAEIDVAGTGDDMFFGWYDWFVADETADSLILLGRARPGSGADPGYADASLAREADRWVPRGWGTCRIQVTAADWGNAGFVLDPAVEPDPESSTLSVLATENACANGKPPTGRVVRSVVVAEDEASVSIVILVEPTGTATCPGNPAFEFEVDLGRPLGDRAVLDGSVDPPQERKPRR